ncbi:1-deoxy-D-xylulose-5-phosphate reductoisomerase [candidate division KSB1 bacterium]|nr:1-deoxy-D-xylulose-5-phosphate reductoisomerase [candidate division KSB1 bacterium]RQW05744.1 MAG: 1-deoxy-D-xylulose-5-phosphate reductoisomerase [candidate division KSB1 bacterium]
MVRKKIIILGSTGSIGTNALYCVDASPNAFEVIALSTHVNVDLLLQQAARYRPKAVAVTGRPLSEPEKNDLKSLDIRFFEGEAALVDMLHDKDFDMLVNAVVGAAGFMPTLAAVDKSVDIALANKESLVIGGEIVMPKVKEKNVRLLPIDSEHSAIFQCLMGENYADIEEILLTASGGPFRTFDDFKHITLTQALHHPNWSMGKKITIDSATMMNKGLEVIEARWLFDVPVEKIRIIIHPQSIIHSMVAFHDGSIKAQLGMPDMRVPIQLAMTYPKRQPSAFPRLDWTTLKELTFAEPDFEKFPCPALAIEALKTGGTAPAVLNAANEIAVARFIREEISFDQIPALIEKVLLAHDFVSQPTVEDVLGADQWARKYIGTRV